MGILARVMRCTTAATLAIVVGLFTVASSPHAQSLILRTATLNAIGESVGMYAEQVNVSSQHRATPSVHLPGQHALGPPIIIPEADLALFTSTGELVNRDFITACRAGRFGQYTPLDLNPPRSASIRAVTLATSAQENGPRVLVQAITSDKGVSTLVTRTLADATWTDPTATPLPGPPIAIAMQRNLGRVAVLCLDNGDANAVLHIRDVFSGRTIIEQEVITTSDGRYGDARAIAARDDGSIIAIATSGYAASDDTRVWATWIHLHDGLSGQRLAPPLELPGQLAPDGAIAIQDESIWVATHDPSRGEGYISRVDIQEGTHDLAMRHTMSAPRRPPLLAFSTSNSDVIAAVGDRVELLPGGEPRGVVRRFDQPIRALHWSAGGLFVGAGNTVHAIATPSLETLHQVALQSGVVDAIVPVPAEVFATRDPDQDGLGATEEDALATSRTNPDTDNDGLHDGVDARPTVTSPLLEVPRAITLHAEAAGYELRGVRIRGDHLAGYRWRIEYDRERLPWLAVAPLSGTGPGVFYAGIDPDLWDGDSNEPIQSALKISLADDDGPATGSPATIALEILPPRNPLRRVLWLHPAKTMAELRGDDQPFAKFAARLSQSPQFFSQRTSGAETPDDLGAYTLVIAPATSLIDAGISRARLLDYVIDGGALLFLGDYSAATDAIGVLDNWLAPAGITLNLTAPLEGRIGQASRDPLAADWEPLALRNGVALQTLSPARAIVSAPDQGADLVAIAQYGRGRIAALAAVDIVTKPRYEDGEGAFMLTLIDWLARARVDTRDTDGDGLPDDVEDRDRDGVVDAGESDFIHPDTDGDGVPDNEEDRNASGSTDDGETSALNRDSDGDGIWDGADSAPLPARGAPRVDSVRPNTVPAEGGQTVLIRGENFAPDCAVWFGEVPASFVRVQSTSTILVETPPAVGEGQYTVRVQNPSTAMAGALPDSFTYTSVTEVGFELVSLGPARFGIKMDLPEGVRVGRISCRIDSAEGSALEWRSVAPGGLSNMAQRELQQTEAPEGGLRLQWNGGRTITTGGVLATVSYAGDEAPQVHIAWARVHAANGVPLKVRHE